MKKKYYQLDGVSISIGSQNTANGQYSTSTCIPISPKKFKIHILGDDFDFNFPVDSDTLHKIVLINTLGYKYYNELKKNGFKLNNDIEDIIIRKFRDIKINDILDGND